MSPLNMALIVLSVITVIAVVLALKTSLFIKDEKERTQQAVNFLLGILAGYVFASPLGGILLGVAKESGDVILSIHQRLFNQDRMLSLTRAFMFWIIGGFFGSSTLEHFRHSVMQIFGS